MSWEKVQIKYDGHLRAYDLADLELTRDGGGDLITDRVDVVDLNVLELVTDQAAQCVDLVDRHNHAVAHLLAVRGDEAAKREDANYVDGPLLLNNRRCLGCPFGRHLGGRGGRRLAG